jgi:hypothetical protein
MNTNSNVFICMLCAVISNLKIPVSMYAVVVKSSPVVKNSIEEKMYTRSNTKISKIKGSHAVYISQPDAVAKVIIEAAQTTSNTN